ALAIGTSGCGICGLLPALGAALVDGRPSAGLLVSRYALNVASGALLLTALSGRVPRKALLAELMALFTVGNRVAWQAPGYESLIVARILTGLAHGAFVSVGSILATTIVPQDKAARATETKFSGSTDTFAAGGSTGPVAGTHVRWR
ncbi:MFS transporter, partial [Burkholderia cenocepacia]|uniref:MFS transporter n=1 Tax=Burkholderia cenocepacia TaxID=95486 RepID=UPI00406CA337